MELYEYCVSGRYLSWFDTNSNSWFVFFHAESLYDSEVKDLAAAIDLWVSDNASWLIPYGATETEDYLVFPPIRIEPKPSENASASALAAMQYSEHVEHLFPEEPKGTDWRGITFNLSEAAYKLEDEIRFGRVDKLQRIFFLLDVGGGPLVFRVENKLTAIQCDWILSTVTQLAHERGVILTSFKELDRINDPERWMDCLAQCAAADSLRNDYTPNEISALDAANLLDLNGPISIELNEIISTLLNSIRGSKNVDLPVPISQVPKWDGLKLYVGGKFICKISRKANNQRLILGSFEELGWQTHIDDPLPGGKDSQRLRETIRSLNGKQQCIEFKADGTGAGVVWEFRGCSSARELPALHP